MCVLMRQCVHTRVVMRVRVCICVCLNTHVYVGALASLDAFVLCCSCTLVFLRVEHSMGVDGVIPGGHVPEVDHNDFVHLGHDHGPQVAKPLGPLGLHGVGGVGVLTEHGLLIHPADTIRPLLQVYR